MIEKQIPTLSAWKKHLYTHPLKAHGIWARMKEYVPGWGYSKAEIDGFFEGETGGGKKQVHWDSLTGKPATFTPSAHASAHQADGADPLSNPLLLGASPVIGWQSGSLMFRTDVANGNTKVEIKGQGTGYGELCVYDPDNLEYIRMTTQGGKGYIYVEGTAPASLRLQSKYAQDIECFRLITSGNPYFYIYGYQIGVGVKWLRQYVAGSGIAYFESQERLIIRAQGSNVGIFGGSYFKLEDNNTLRFGGGSDYAAGYHEPTDTFQIVDGATLNASIRAKLNASGQWFFSGSAFYIDSTWLTAHNKVKDSDKVDGEHAADIVTDARVKAHFPDTIANILSDHDKAAHDALGLSHDSLADVSIDDHHAKVHAAEHKSGGGDAIKLDEFATPDDNINLNASINRHGLLKKFPNDYQEFLGGTGVWTKLVGSTGIAIYVLSKVSTTTRNSNDAEQWTTEPNFYVKLKETKMGEPAGAMRIWFEMRTETGGFMAFAKIYKNGVAVSAVVHSTDNATYQTRSEDIGACDDQDLIQIYGKGTAGERVFVRNMRFQYDRAITYFGDWEIITPIATVLQTAFIMQHQDP